MNGYELTIERLLASENDLADEERLLSVYLPTSGFDKERSKLEMKSYVLSNFRRNEELGKFTRLHHNIIDRVTVDIQDLEKVDKGLAVFIKFNPQLQEKGREKKIAGQDVLTVILSKEPENQFFLGRAYNLDKLAWLSFEAENALVLNVNQEEVGIYKLWNGEVDRVELMENPYVSERENEYLERFTPTSYKETIYGSGSDKWKRDLEDRVISFLNEVKIYLKHRDKYGGDFKDLVIVYSTKVEDYIKKFVEEASQILPINKPILIDKNLTNLEQLRKEVLETYRREKEKEKHQYLQWTSEEDRDKFRQGWEEVLKESRRQKIDVLFFREDTTSPGYLMDKKLLYMRRVKGAKRIRKVGNLVPWLIKNVLENGGKVMLFDKESEVPQVAARIRY